MIAKLGSNTWGGISVKNHFPQNDMSWNLSFEVQLFREARDSAVWRMFGAPVVRNTQIQMYQNKTVISALHLKKKA